MIRELRGCGRPFEVVICENGSTDGTFECARGLQQAHPEVQLVRIPSADTGLALRHALAASTGDLPVIFSADFWSLEFVRQALRQLGECDMVVGSKVMPGAQDRRPLVRKGLTRIFNGLLRLLFNFQGTDTTGLKVFKRSSFLPIVAECVTQGGVFETELVIRGQRRGLKIREIPVEVSEIRPRNLPSLLLRLPTIIRGLVRLWFSLK